MSSESDQDSNTSLSDKVLEELARDIEASGEPFGCAKLCCEHLHHTRKSTSSISVLFGAEAGDGAPIDHNGQYSNYKFYLLADIQWPGDIDPYSEELIGHGSEEYAYILRDMGLAEKQKQSKLKQLSVAYGSFEKWSPDHPHHPAALNLIMWHTHISLAVIHTLSHRQNLYMTGYLPQDRDRLVREYSYDDILVKVKQFADSHHINPDEVNAYVGEMRKLWD
ncbi:hypothetical protein ABBQ38_004907 [Trebouxia sp. C0009 RCD-2024]